MKVTLDTELWIYEAMGETILAAPLVKLANGKGAPGLIRPRPRVLEPGTVLEIEVVREDS